MRNPIFASVVAVAALIPSLAYAQSNCERQRSGQVVGTVAGAGIGGLLGNGIAGRGDKTLGTIIGAVGGAVIGSQVTRPSGDCRHALGYYDKSNRWHATGVAASDATGYYDRDGSWVDGTPNGHYGDSDRWIANEGQSRDEGRDARDGGWVPASANGYYDRNDQWVAGSDGGYYDGNGRWVRTAQVQATQLDRRADAYGFYDAQGMWHANAVEQGRATGYYDRDNTWVVGTPNGHYDARHNWVPHRDDGSASGSYDSHNRWIPSSSNGYYDNAGQWVAGTASGYYDRRGQWVAGVTTGHYDARGRWLAGEASSHRDSNGNWVADPALGFYDGDGRWNPGETAGYYNSNGRWIATSREMVGADRSGPRHDIMAQLARIDAYIGSRDGRQALSRQQMTRLQREMRSIRSRERFMQHDARGDLSIRDEAGLQVRIDRLNDRLQINPS